MDIKRLNQVKEEYNKFLESTGQSCTTTFRQWCYYNYPEVHQEIRQYFKDKYGSGQRELDRKA